MPTKDRPLSPHLQIYKPQLTSILSISHRMSGVFLALGSVLLVVWLLALAAGPAAYATIQDLLGSWFGQLCLLGFCFALCYHLCNGIRHLFWDMGVGFPLKSIHTSGYFMLLSAVALTSFFWLYGLSQIGPNG